MGKLQREIIKENKEYLENLLKETENKHIIYRIQMLIFLKTNPEIKLTEVCELLPVSYSTIARWWNDYKKEGLNKLLE
ncbi:MAG: hypothetical protein DSY59_04330 [Persephonella sp.]|nr:MAG: hypothetical protein DSY59_04330 [Persephonella sp.]